MAYIKNTWVDQEVERPRTYQKEDHADGSFTLIDDFGLVSELGTPVNADNMNHIEEGIGEHEERITALENLPDVYLKTNQITNCITEIPQRIKADVVDGTLTVYAGSVAIVPYGTTDRTSEFPIGSTFIHENFKVVDTQFADDKFFVWVELQGNIQVATTISDTKERLVEINLKDNHTRGVINTISSATQNSGTSNCVNYRTDLNIVQYSELGTLDADDVISLPILKVKADGTYVYGSITQTFNGIGYIGSTIWADKGVKGLIPNGRNADGTCKNIEFTTSKFMTKTDKGTYTWRIILNDADLGNNLTFNYDAENNYNQNQNGTISNYCDVGSVVRVDGLITSFNPKQPFRAVDYNDIDGKWTKVTKTIFSDKTFAKGALTTYNCKDILPNDGNLYECIFRSFWSCGGKVAGAYVQGVTWGSFGKTLWWQDASTIALLQGNGTYSFGNMSSSEVQITGCSLLLLAYRKVR